MMSRKFLHDQHVLKKVYFLGIFSLVLDIELTILEGEIKRRGHMYGLFQNHVQDSDFDEEEGVYDYLNEQR